MGIFNKRLDVGWKSIAWVMDDLSFLFGWTGPHIALFKKILNELQRQQTAPGRLQATTSRTASRGEFELKEKGI